MRWVVLAAGALLPFTLSAGSLVLGVHNGDNFIPFGGPASGYPGTRYQEAYASSLFSSLSGPISITAIDFFPSFPGGTLYGGTYQLSLSTISAGVNTLSDTNFDGNLGANNTVFTTVALSGPAPSELTFTGGPFTYNFVSGNLLLDIKITNPSVYTGKEFEDCGGGCSGIARYHNFGTATIGYGLVTEFDFSALGIPEPGTLILFGAGLAALLLRRK